MSPETSPHPNTNEFFDIGPSSVKENINDKLNTKEKETIVFPEVVGGGYTLVGQLGGGGFGDTYVATKGGLSIENADTEEAEYVVKVIKPELLKDEIVRERFQREITSHVVAEAISPYVVTIIDTVTILDSKTGNETLGLVTSRMRDGDLTHVCEKMKEEGKKVDDLFIAHIGIEVAKALKGVHEAGYVHRDIKPANIFVNKKPFFVKLGDFGIAKSLEDIQASFDPDQQVDKIAGKGGDSHMTQKGLFTGTPQFVPPEVMCGNQAGEERDLYGLGLMLYILRTGNHPFVKEYTSSAQEGMRAQAFQQPPSIESMMKDSYTWSPFDEIIDTLIANKPGHRRVVEIDGKDYEIDTAQKIEILLEALVKQQGI